MENVEPEGLGVCAPRAEDRCAGPKEAAVARSSDTRHSDCGGGRTDGAACTCAWTAVWPLCVGRGTIVFLRGASVVQYISLRVVHTLRECSPPSSEVEHWNPPVSRVAPVAHGPTFEGHVGRQKPADARPPPLTPVDRRVMSSGDTQWRQRTVPWGHPFVRFTLCAACGGCRYVNSGRRRPGRESTRKCCFCLCSVRLCRNHGTVVSGDAQASD